MLEVRRLQGRSKAAKVREIKGQRNLDGKFFRLRVKAAVEVVGVVEVVEVVEVVVAVVVVTAAKARPFISQNLFFEQPQRNQDDGKAVLERVITNYSETQTLKP